MRVDHGVAALLSVGLLMNACTGVDDKAAGRNVYGDEMHRPQDWSGEISLIIREDTVADDIEKLVISASSVSGSFEELIDQCYHIAFSGDARVFVADLFGEMDKKKALGPEELLNELQAFDTLTVEDIYTGAMHDTVVDVSFTRSKVSALIVFLACWQKGGQWMMTPYTLSVGRQVFNESNGDLRGVSNEFFIEMNTDMEPGADAVFQRLYILSDSNGVFHPGYFSQYTGEGQNKLGDRLPAPSEQGWEMKFSARLDYAGQKFVFDRVKIDAVNDETAMN